MSEEFNYKQAARDYKADEIKRCGNYYSTGRVPAYEAGFLKALELIEAASLTFDHRTGLQTFIDKLRTQNENT